MKIDKQVYQEVFGSMPLGLIILNEQQEIISWNTWMQAKTHLSEEDVMGKVLQDLFPDMQYNRLDWACEQIFNFGAPQVISQILNKYIIPIPLDKDQYENMDLMQQHVEILPLENESGWLALLVIQDVTSAVHQKNILMEMGHKLEQESFHDALTGIYNRRFLWEHLEQQIAKAKRESHAIACLMLDLDHFKQINDDYGHDKGDQVLLAFVATINRAIRTGDVFVRYGGEEFILLVSNSDQASIQYLAERILKSFEQDSVKVLEQHPVTCSIGISFWDVEHSQGGKLLIEQADKALYLAKESGRNCYKYYSQVK